MGLRSRVFLARPDKLQYLSDMAYSTRDRATFLRPAELGGTPMMPFEATWLASGRL